MADLMTEMPQQRAVWFVHLDPQLLAVNVVAFGEIQRDHAVVVAGEHLLRARWTAGRRPDRSPGLRRGRRSAASARTARRSAGAWPFRHRRRPPTPSCRCRAAGCGSAGTTRTACAPDAFSTSQLHCAKCIFAHSSYRSASTKPGLPASGPSAITSIAMSWSGEPERTIARQAHRVLERQMLTAVGTDEITHEPPPLRMA